MIFVLRKLVKKFGEQNSKALFTFIDLKRAYDSVTGQAMWLALSKLRIPDLIRSSSYQVFSSRYEGQDPIKWCNNGMN